MRLVVTDGAKQDLHEIDRYTRRTWGSAQADDYRWLIIESFAKLLERPTRGRGQDHFVRGLRRLNVRRHAVFYFVRGDHLVISRVLHQSMDIGARFFETEDQATAWRAVADIRRLALALPEAVEADHHGIPSFRVAGKIFCAIHRDRPRMMVKLDPEDQRNLAEAQPGVVEAAPGYWGRKGSTFVWYEPTDAALIETLLGMAYVRVAPKRLKPTRL